MYPESAPACLRLACFASSEATRLVRDMAAGWRLWDRSQKALLLMPPLLVGTQLAGPLSVSLPPVELLHVGSHLRPWRAARLLSWRLVAGALEGGLQESSAASRSALACTSREGHQGCSFYDRCGALWRNKNNSRPMTDLNAHWYSAIA